MFGRFTSRRVPAPDLVPAPEPIAEPALELAPAAAAPEPPPDTVARPNTLLSDKLLDAKVGLHRRLIEEFHLSVLQTMPDDEVRRQVHVLVTHYTPPEQLAHHSQQT